MIAASEDDSKARAVEMSASYNYINYQSYKWWILFLLDLDKHWKEPSHFPWIFFIYCK